MSSFSQCSAWIAAKAPGHLLAAILHPGAVLRSRRDLSRLEDHLLRDIGLTRAEAMAEACRPAWDAPLHWRG